MATNTVKRILCLANSRKYSGRCIAGKEILESGHPGGWIRPVSARENEEVSEYERQYEDGSDPRLLDVIDVPLLRALPKDYQQENWLLNPQYYWKKVRRLPRKDLVQFIDTVEQQLWTNGHSTYNGANDQVPLDIARSLRESLRLILIEDLTLSVFAPGEAFGNNKRRVQGRFHHSDTEYRLWVTDPSYERGYLQKPDDEYPIGRAFLTLSLGEPYKGYSYKLIAAIIEP